MIENMILFRKQDRSTIVLCIILYCNALIGVESVRDSVALWEAEFYDENSKLQQKIAENFLDFLQEKEFPFHGRLLDIGCGTGRLTSSIQSRFPKVSITGVDASKEMVQFANQNFASANVTFYHDRAEELKAIDNNSIDAILSFSCLHWVHDQEAAFRAMHRVLKSGGWIGITFCAETGIDDPMDYANTQAIQEEPWNEYFKDSKREVEWYIAKPAVIKSQLEKVGFQVHFMGVQPFDFVFNDAHAFERWILACFLELKLLPPDLQLSCAKRIVELYLQATAHFQPKGPQCIYRIVESIMFMAQK